MSSAAVHAPRPQLAGCTRSYELQRCDQWRAEVDGAWGTVTGFHMLGSEITAYRVAFDNGAAYHVWTAAVRPGPAPAARPALVCLPGGRS